MSQELWSAVDAFLVTELVGDDPALEAALAATEAAGLPAISVAPNQGKLLQLLALIRGARSILEVGTLGGYSTIWMARALPADGELVTLELDPHHAEVARSNIANAGLAEHVEVIVGPALDSLAALDEEGRGPFDLVFIDADKQHNADYFQWAVRLGRSGTVIVVDNVVRGGGLLVADSDDEAVQGTRRLYEAVAAEARVTATAVQTVGSKGHDGFLIAVII